MSDENKPIGLAEMIDSLRQELLEAQVKASGSAIVFEVENIDLELKVNVERTTKVGGGVGIKFWVVNADTKGEQADTTSTVQTIKLSLSAKDNKNLDEDGNPRSMQTMG